MKKIILVLLYICCAEAVYNETQEVKAEAAGIPRGEWNLQKVSISTNKTRPNFIFWWTEKTTMIYTDEVTDTSFTIHYDTADKEKVDYFANISGEALAFQIPVKYNSRKDFIASDNKIRLIQYSNSARTKYEVTSPIITLPDHGFKIGRAHADRDGALYFLYNYNLRVRDPKKGSRLYRLYNKNATKVHTFQTKVQDFVFSYNYSQIFFITHDKQCVDLYDVDIKTGSLSNKVKYFNVSDIAMQTGADMKLNSIEIDKDGIIYLAAGRNIIRVPPESREVNKIMQIPEDVTAITFGGYKDRNLLLTTKKNCDHNQIQAGSLFLISGLPEDGGRGDPSARW